MILRKTAITLLLLVFAFSYVSGQHRDKFVFSQLKYRGGNWDVYSTGFDEIINMLVTTTSIKPEMKRNDIALSDRNLFISPFLWMTGDSEFNEFSQEETRILRQYLLCGGLMVIDDTTGSRNYGFDLSVRRLIKALFPDRELQRIPEDHAIYRSFYLMKGPAGRRLVNRYMEGIDVDSRTVLVYSQNNIYGAWARDRLGNWLYECIPDGELQRVEAMKLTINLVVFSLTGTYKKDMIHQQYIDQKLRMRR